MLFARFALIYTHRFESAYGDEDMITQAKREWGYSLAGTPVHLVEQALQRCKLELAWPPTIAEFVRFLTPEPESLGLPATQQAYLEACQNSHAPLQVQWSHPAVLLAAREVGHFQLRSEAEHRTRPVFEQAYRDLVARVAQGETLEVTQPKALPEPDLSQEQALVDDLLAAGLPPTEAYPLAYYMEKPLGSEVRKHYRQHSQQKLDALKVKVELPE